MSRGYHVHRVHGLGWHHSGTGNTMNIRHPRRLHPDTPDSEDASNLVRRRHYLSHWSRQHSHDQPHFRPACDWPVHPFHCRPHRYCRQLHLSLHNPKHHHCRPRRRPHHSLHRFPSVRHHPAHHIHLLHSQQHHHLLLPPHSPPSHP